MQSEYPELTRRFFAEHGVQADVRLSYGASEAKIPDIADCVVDITETGRALRAAGLQVIDTILTSYTEVVANPACYADPVKRKAMEQLMTLLNGALDARGKVLLKVNVSAERLDAVLAVLPTPKSPTVNQLANGDYAIESVVEKRDQPRHPSAHRGRRHRPARDPDLKIVHVIACSDAARSSSSTSEVGWASSIADDGDRFPFHCIEIADGTRDDRRRPGRDVRSAGRSSVATRPRHPQALTCRIRRRDADAPTNGSAASSTC